MKRWKFSEDVPEEAFETLSDFPRFIAAMLWRRGVRTKDEAERFLKPDWERDVHDPFLFQDMQKAVDRILVAVRDKEPIVIHGDYDADGVSGSVILHTVMKELGAEFSVFIPHREKEGYGMNPATIEKLADGGCKLIITTDCGISNAEEISLAVEKGIDVIITDHHDLPEELPPAHSILHPRREGETYPFLWLTGGGVAFKLAQALWRAGNLPEGHEKWLTDIVSISTVADFGKLTGENRTLVHYGLQVLRKSRRPGLKKLIEKSRLNERGKIDTGGIGFQIAPRINAAGRMDHARLAYDLLVSDDEAFISAQADLLEGHNNDRRNRTRELMTEACKTALSQKDRSAMIIVGEGWPAALCGLVASRLVNLYHRPVIVLGKNEEGKYHGSGRSRTGFHITEALRACSDSLAKFGGHAEACGMTISDEECLEKFESAFFAYAKEKLEGEELVPYVEIEDKLSLVDVNARTIDLLESLEPFGVGNPKPKFLLENVKVESAKRVGKEGGHLSLLVSDDDGHRLKLIAFRMGERAEEFPVGSCVDIVVELEMNEWKGYRSPQGQVVDLRLAHIKAIA